MHLGLWNKKNGPYMRKWDHFMLKILKKSWKSTEIEKIFESQWAGY